MYGVGDGSTTFTVASMGGLTPAGREASATRLTATHFGGDSTALGATGGLESHTLTTAQLAAHSHGVTDPGHAHSISALEATSTTLGTLLYRGSVNGSGFAPGTIASNTTGISINNAGSGSAHNNVQPTIITNYIIFAGV